MAPNFSRKYLDSLKIVYKNVFLPLINFSFPKSPENESFDRFVSKNCRHVITGIVSLEFFICGVVVEFSDMNGKIIIGGKLIK